MPPRLLFLLPLLLLLLLSPLELSTFLFGVRDLPSNVEVERLLSVERPEVELVDDAPPLPREPISPPLCLNDDEEEDDDEDEDDMDDDGDGDLANWRSAGMLVNG